MRRDKKKKKSLNDFTFGTFIGRFPSDGAASLAAKGLTTTYGCIFLGGVGFGGWVYFINVNVFCSFSLCESTCIHCVHVAL